MPSLQTKTREQGIRTNRLSVRYHSLSLFQQAAQPTQPSILLSSINGYLGDAINLIAEKALALVKKQTTKQTNKQTNKLFHFKNLFHFLNQSCTAYITESSMDNSTLPFPFVLNSSNIAHACILNNQIPISVMPCRDFTDYSHRCRVHISTMVQLTDLLYQTNHVCNMKSNASHQKFLSKKLTVHRTDLNLQHHSGFSLRHI